jgi:type I restriction enzyme S subunit
MKKYSSYKPSGVNWIGDIPKSWDKKKLKYITKSINGYSFKSDDFDREFDIPVIRIGDVGDIIDFDNSVKVKSNFLEDKKDFIVKKDDILIGLTGGTIGKSGRYNYEFPSLLNQRVGLLRNNGLVINGLLYYYVKSDIFIRYIFYYCYGGGQDNISMNDILNMVFPYPPLQEQQQIVKYLDDKTTIIDKLISTKQRKVELLKEQRTTLINQVITKGLNPNVKMKDSGVEWIGEIPESWSVNKLKSLVDSNKKVLSENTNPDYELKYIEIGDVNSLGEIKGMTEYLFKDSPSRCRRILSKGDIFISTVRTYLKSIGYVENEISDVICSTGFCVLTPKSDVLSKYLFYQVLTEFFIGEVISKSVGVSYPSITSTELINIKIIKPSIKEQQEIVEYLDKYSKEIDDLVSMEQNKIELLKEYRQSLISEVITGKIKVSE